MNNKHRSPTSAESLDRRDDLVQRSVDQGLDWLSNLAMQHAGAVPSWTNPAHPGYAYPEAAGLSLTVLAQQRPNDRAIPSIVAWLEGRVDERGQVGRDELGYAFDSGMVLTGLCAATRAGANTNEKVTTRLFEGLARSIQHRRATESQAAPDRWSTRWSCHQLKLAWALSAYEEVSGDPRAASLIGSTALLELLDLERDGIFSLAPDDPRTYYHAHCYALEGVLALRRRGIDPAGCTARLIRGADALVAIQRPDGSFAAWLHDDHDRRPSDIIAQALRIFLAVDRPERYAEAIARARGCLERRRTSRGGLRYLPEGEDLNTWCLAFATQALAWARKPPGPDDWLA